MKKELRQEAKRGLRALSPEYRESAGLAIAEKVAGLPEFRTSRVILIYAALPEEVPTRLIADHARSFGIQVTYPRCLPEGRELALHHVDSEEDLLLDGRYGISEPAPHCPVTDPEMIDLAFVPGLAWDRAGNRLGRGAGYYDRLLADPGWRAVTCGLFFSRQEVSKIPTDPWDVPLDMIVTDQEVWRRPSS